jgi:hypothetical protein
MIYEGFGTPQEKLTRKTGDADGRGRRCTRSLLWWLARVSEVAGLKLKALGSAHRPLERETDYS